MPILWFFSLAQAIRVRLLPANPYCPKVTLPQANSSPHRHFRAFVQLSQVDWNILVIWSLCFPVLFVPSLLCVCVRYAWRSRFGKIWWIIQKSELFRLRRENNVRCRCLLWLVLIGSGHNMAVTQFCRFYMFVFIQFIRHWCTRGQNHIASNVYIS